MTRPSHGVSTALVRSESGSAVVEFVLFSIVALIPLAWAALALQQVVAVHQATQAAAGESLRAFLTAASEAEAYHRADAAAGLSLEARSAVTGFGVEVACGSPPCLRAGSSVRVTVSARAELPPIPVLGVAPSLTATAEQYGVVDAFVAAR